MFAVVSLSPTFYYILLSPEHCPRNAHRISFYCCTQHSYLFFFFFSTPVFCPYYSMPLTYPSSLIILHSSELFAADCYVTIRLPELWQLQWQRRRWIRILEIRRSQGQAEYLWFSQSSR